MLVIIKEGFGGLKYTPGHLGLYTLDGLYILDYTFWMYNFCILVLNMNSKVNF